jgi:hypothetical protein
MIDFLPAKYRTRVLLAPQTTANAAQAYAKPTAGTMAINIRGVAVMGNAADLVLTLNSADDAAGTNAAAFPVNVPIYVNGVRATDAKAVTIADATGNFIVDFCVDPGLIPAGKFVGVSYANSNIGNLLTTQIVEDVTNKPTAS